MLFSLDSLSLGIGYGISGTEMAHGPPSPQVGLHDIGFVVSFVLEFGTKGTLPLRAKSPVLNFQHTLLL